MKVVLPIFISTTDDTTMFTFEGSVNGRSGYIINKGENSVQSAFTKESDSTESLRGIRMRHSISFNAVGNATPLYVTVYGLGDDELPPSTCPSGVLTISVPGLCYGGNQDCSNETEGYLVCLRSTKKDESVSTDQINHVQYRNNVLLPWIEKNKRTLLTKRRMERW